MSVASLAQLVEQLIRNQQVKSSSLLAGSTEFSPHGENREGFFCWMESLPIARFITINVYVGVETTNALLCR